MPARQIFHLLRHIRLDNVERSLLTERIDAQQTTIDELMTKAEEAQTQPSAKVVIQEREVIKVVTDDKKIRELQREVAEKKEEQELLNERCIKVETDNEKLDRKNDDLIGDLNRVRRERDNNVTAAKRQATKANEESRLQKETLKKLTRSKEEALSATRERQKLEDENNLIKEHLQEVTDNATKLTTELERVQTKRNTERTLAESKHLEVINKYNDQVDTNERTKSKLNRNIGNQRTTMDKQAAEITQQKEEIKKLKELVKIKQAEIEKGNTALKSNINERVSPQIVAKIQERDRRIQDLESQLAKKEAVLDGYKLIPKELKASQDSLILAQEEIKKERAKSAQLLKIQQEQMKENGKLKSMANESADSGNATAKFDESRDRFELENQIESLKLELTQAKAMVGSAQAAVDSEIEKGRENLREFKQANSEKAKSLAEAAVAEAAGKLNNDLLNQNRSLKNCLTEKMVEAETTAAANHKILQKNRLLEDNLNKRLKEIEVKGTVKSLAKSKADSSRLAADNRALKKKLDEGDKAAKLAMEFLKLEGKADQDKIGKLTKSNRELGERNVDLSKLNKTLNDQVTELTNPSLFAKAGALEIKNTVNRLRKPSLRSRSDNQTVSLKKPAVLSNTAKSKAAQTTKKRGKAGKSNNSLSESKSEGSGSERTVVETDKKPRDDQELTPDLTELPPIEEQKTEEKISVKLTKMAIRGDTVPETVVPETVVPETTGDKFEDQAEKTVDGDPEKLTKDGIRESHSEELSLGSDFGSQPVVPAEAGIRGPEQDETKVAATNEAVGETAKKDPKL